MNTAELRVFSRRMQNAARRGYSVANSDAYAAGLSKEAGLPKPASVSASDLAELALVILAKRAGKPTPKPEPKPVPVPTPKPESEPEPEPEEEEGYETWTRDDLYEEAKIRKLAGRSEMNRAELIEALETDDKN